MMPDAQSILVEYLLDLPSGRRSWQATLEPTPGTTTFLPTTLPADVAEVAAGVPGVFHALVWHHNAAGEVIGSDAPDGLYVLADGTNLISQARPAPIEGTVLVRGVQLAVVDDGMPVLTRQVTEARGRLADETEVDREE